MHCPKMQNYISDVALLLLHIQEYNIMEYQLIKSNYENIPLSAVERVLTNRGIERQDISHYLNTTD